AFWKRLNPLSKKHIYTPSILLVMIRTLEFSGVSYKSLRLKFADLYMHPDLLKFKRTDFHLADGILSAGYECMRKNILHWLKQPDALARRPDLAERSLATRAQTAVVQDPSPGAPIAVGEIE